MKSIVWLALACSLAVNITLLTSPTTRARLLGSFCAHEGTDICSLLGVDDEGLAQLALELRGVPWDAVVRGPRAPASRRTYRYPSVGRGDRADARPDPPEFSEPRLFSAFVSFFRHVASLRMFPFVYPPFLYHPRSRGRAITRHPIERWLNALQNQSYPTAGTHGRCLDWGSKYQRLFPLVCTQPHQIRYSRKSCGGEWGSFDEAGVRGFCADLEAAPHIPTGFLDVVFCTQVFEHLKHPWLAAAELYRMLAPGGVLLFSVPFLEIFHTSGGAADYYRYTSHGVVALFESVGFCVQDIRVAGSWLTTAGYLMGLGQWDFSAEELEEENDHRVAHTILAILTKSRGPPHACKAQPPVPCHALERLLPNGERCGRRRPSLKPGARWRVSTQANTQTRHRQFIPNDSRLVKYWMQHGANASLALSGAFQQRDRPYGSKRRGQQGGR